MMLGREVAILGGIGRSGTSIVRDCVRSSNDITSFGELEAKFIAEKYGLLDLYRALVTDYRIDVASQSLSDFETVMLKHMTNPNYYGQGSILEVFGSKADVYPSVVKKFVRNLRKGKYVEPCSEEKFFKAANDLLLDLIVMISPSGRPDAVFVEKTPHNVFNPWFFQKLFHAPKFLWVVRDPRPIAFSLLKMNWGPSDLESACEWVSVAFDRFFASRHEGNARTVTLEDLAKDPGRTIADISAHLGIEMNVPQNFIEADRVNAWTKNVSESDIALVNRRLSKTLKRYQAEFQ